MLEVAAVTPDWMMGFLLFLAFLIGVVSVWNAGQLLRVGFFQWRTRRFVRKCHREDELAKYRRRRAAYGDTLIDEIGKEWGR